MNFSNIHEMLQVLYTNMLQHTEQMQGIARLIAGLGALFYVAYRVWQNMAKAEPIEVFPLLRPIALGICISFFPTLVLGTLNSVLSPIVQGTHQMMENETFSMQVYLEKKEQLEKEIMLRSPATAYIVDDDEYERQLSKLGITNVSDRVGMYVDRTKYQIEKKVQQWFHSLLEIIFQAAALIIDVLRTFFLIVLSILGPIAFGISVWDGFQSTLSQWFTRYIGIYLWLPVSDLFSTIIASLQKLTLENDIAKLNDPSFVPETYSAIYIIFMLIGIVGYLSVPTVASWIVQSGGGGSYMRSLNTAGAKIGGAIGGFAGASAGNMAGRTGGALSQMGQDFKRDMGKLFNRNAEN